MRVFKKLIVAIVAAAFMMSSAASVLADETTKASEPSSTESSSETSSTFDISKMDFNTMYGNQIIDFLNHEYVFDGEKIPVTESNYYFLLTFLQLSQYAAYGYYPATTEGYIDLAATYGEDKKTFAEYYIKQAEDYLQSTYILVKRAKEAGIKLTDEDKKAIDDEIKERTEQQAKPAGVPLDTILALYFGPGCDEKAYREILTNATYAGKYQEKYQKDYKIPEDQMMVPKIQYALFYAPGASATADEKKKAETAANDFLKQCKTVADLKTAAEKGQKEGTVYNQGEITVRKGELVSSFEQWAFDANRKEGEMSVIYAQEYGYFVVGYAGKVKLDKSEFAEVASEALNAEIEAEMKADKHGFKGNKAFPTPKPAPTAAPSASEPSGDPAVTEPVSSETMPSALPSDNGDVAAQNGMSKVLIIVFISVGGLAILAVIGILISNYMNSKKVADDVVKTVKSVKSAKEKEAAKKKEAPKKASKIIPEEDEDEEDDEEEYEDEDEEETFDPYSGLSEEDEAEDDKKNDKKNEKKNGKNGRK